MEIRLKGKLSAKDSLLSAASRSLLAKRIYRRHLGFVRELRDMYIFLQQGLPLLQDAKDRYAGSSHKKDRRYYIPAVGRRKFARRKDAELKAIFDRYIGRSLYETFLVSGVSQFETFLIDVLSLVLHEYPKSITRKVLDMPACSTVPVDVILDASSREGAIDQMIERHLAAVMYGRPEAYLRYISDLCGIDISDSVFQDYIEIKATRDLVVHNDSEINHVYLAKAGSKARGNLGDPVGVDSNYFAHCVGVLTRISGIIERDTGRKFPPNESVSR